MEKKYKVQVIAHQLKNNVVAKFGDVVDEGQLNGNAFELVNQGFIVPFDEEEAADVVDEGQEEEEDVKGVILPKSKTQRKEK